MIVYGGAGLALATLCLGVLNDLLDASTDRLVSAMSRSPTPARARCLKLATSSVMLVVWMLLMAACGSWFCELEYFIAFYGAFQAVSTIGFGARASRTMSYRCPQTANGVPTANRGRLLRIRDYSKSDCPGVRDLARDGVVLHILRGVERRDNGRPRGLHRTVVAQRQRCSRASSGGATNQTRIFDQTAERDWISDSVPIRLPSRGGGAAGEVCRASSGTMLSRSELGHQLSGQCGW